VSMKWMIQGAHVLTDAEASPEVADILIENDRISAVGPELNRESLGVQKVVPGRNKLVLPGLINAHLHSHDRFDKGRFDKLPLEVWMSRYNPPTAPRTWTPRECYLRTLLSAMEALRSGTTTIIDDVHPGWPVSRDCLEAVFQAYHDIGLRAQVSLAQADKPFYESIPFLEDLLPTRFKMRPASAPGEFQARVLEVWREFAAIWNDRVRFVLSPSAPHRCTEGFLRATRDLSEETALPVFVHVLETRVQAFTARRCFGKSMVEYLLDQGLLTPLTTLVHCVWVDERDLELISASGCNVVHCPLSNLKLGSGIAPVSKMRTLGITVGLGTDNHNASDVPSMFEAMKLAALIHRSPETDYRRWIGSREALGMATRGGARCGGLQGRTGETKPGYKADLVMLDLDRLSFFPRHDLVNQLVFCEHGESVEMVVVDGNIVMQDGRITTIDEEQVLSELKEALPGIQMKIRNSERTAEELEPALEKAYFRCIAAADETDGKGER
jgi:5-methylthioadenosine/S-adenosylhomocysteine deaminase